jgi:hydrogenase nickel incorporation protein HypA/HybF
LFLESAEGEEMHELSATKSLLKMVVFEAKKNKMRKIKKVTVGLGNLTTYKKDSLLLYYDILKKENSLLSGSALSVKEIKGKVLCRKCGKERIIGEDIMLFCPKCSSSDVKLISGKEFLIKSVEGS